MVHGALADLHCPPVGSLSCCPCFHCPCVWISELCTSSPFHIISFRPQPPPSPPSASASSLTAPPLSCPSGPSACRTPCRSACWETRPGAGWTPPTSLRRGRSGSPAGTRYRGRRMRLFTSGCLQQTWIPHMPHMHPTASCSPLVSWSLVTHSRSQHRRVCRCRVQYAAVYMPVCLAFWSLTLMMFGRPAKVAAPFLAVWMQICSFMCYANETMFAVIL